MKPKLKDSVYYVPIEDGIYFAGLSGSKVMRGENLYKWFESLLPFLDGSHDIDQILEMIPERRHVFVKEFIGQLYERDYILDKTEDDIPIQHSLKEKFESSIRFIEQYSSTPNTTFKRFRGSTIGIYGSSYTAFMVAQALIRMGTEKVVLMGGNFKWDIKEKYAESITNSEERNDFNLSVVTEEKLETNLHNINVFICLNDLSKTENWSLIQHINKNYQIPILPVNMYEDSLYIGPWIGQGTNRCSSCINEQLYLPPGNESAFENIAQKIVAYLISLEVFSYTGGLRTGKKNCVDHSIQLNNQLETTYHYIPRINTCEGCVETQVVGRLNDEVEYEIGEVFLDNLHKLVSPYLGIITHIDEFDLSQTVLSQCSVSISEVGNFSVAARNNMLARFYAIMFGVTNYYQKKLIDNENSMIIFGRSSLEALYKAIVLEMEKNCLESQEILWTPYQDSLTSYASYLERMITIDDQESINICYILTTFELFIFKVTVDGKDFYAAHMNKEKALEDTLEKALFTTMFGQEQTGIYPLVNPSTLNNDEANHFQDVIQQKIASNQFKMTCKELSLLPFINQLGLKIFSIQVSFTGGYLYE
ncbi:hypothetical protein FJQ98_10500 [Lysinibacillus agricola]|uniref:YcaO domain-containing protein n=1 Tax=Lysinibacillus agricola TaxID=2590012 RepID=A0ABX7AWU0_9BACI|nr:MULTISPECIES: hypothetical protein [Lysinibacillus]KOS64281.1 hypothetical protein AN161_03640 [Lysinibacillus sp. FJAT-14222]QQP14401.1 hypothetical protein FJQ98_10500 [Lysinibacillus agricola]